MKVNIASEGGPSFEITFKDASQTEAEEYVFDLFENKLNNITFKSKHNTVTIHCKEYIKSATFEFVN